MVFYAVRCRSVGRWLNYTTSRPVSVHPTRLMAEWCSLRRNGRSSPLTDTRIPFVQNKEYLNSRHPVFCLLIWSGVFVMYVKIAECGGRLMIFAKLPYGYITKWCQKLHRKVNYDIKGRLSWYGPFETARIRWLGNIIRLRWIGRLPSHKMHWVLGFNGVLPHDALSFRV